MLFTLKMVTFGGKKKSFGLKSDILSLDSTMGQ